MRRREFLGVMGGAAAWPLAAGAQQSGKVYRVGVISAFAENDPQSQPRLAAFQQGLERLGWISGRNVHIDFRWNAGSDVAALPALAKDLVALAPDVILVQSNPAVAALRQITSAIPTVFVSVADPVESGFVESLSRPGGNITGFTNFEASMGGKWLGVLKEIAPTVTRVSAILQLETMAHAGFLSAAETVALALGVTVTASSVHNAMEIERAVTLLSVEKNCGLVVMPHPVTTANRELIFKLAAQHRMPAVYAFRFLAADGGLMSYGVDTVEMYRRAATYVDRILRGAKAGELPVQASDKFEMVINLRTARALGLEIPPTFLARADEVIE